MSLTYELPCCCICLCKETEKLFSKGFDTTNSWITKLRTCVSEIDWSEESLICEPCKVQLDVVHDFYLLCLQSHQSRKTIDLDVSKSDIKIEESLLNIHANKYENQSSNAGLEITSNKHGMGTAKIKLEVTSCKFCCLKFEKQSDLDDHYKIAHVDANIVGVISNDGSDTESDSLIIKNVTKRICCDRKKSNVSKSTDLIQTENSPNVNTRKKHSFTCELCGYSCSYCTELVKHMVKEHDVDKKDVKPFICAQCSKRFDKNTLLLQHMKFHDGIRNSVCPYCGKAYITKGELHIHEKTHLNKREYQCTLCPKRFNTSGDRNRHKLVVHTDPNLWKYVCDICTKRLPSKSHYDTHMRRHNNDKPFACHLCEKRFCDKIVLQKHLRSHSNVRPYKCLECEKEYKDKGTMQLHMARIHKTGNINIPERVKKYICHLCPKSYYDKGKLTKHLYSHTGERPFACSICNKKFTDKSYVKHHMKTVHSFVADTVHLLY